MFCRLLASGGCGSLSSVGSGSGCCRWAPCCPPRCCGFAVLPFPLALFGIGGRGCGETGRFVFGFMAMDKSGSTVALSVSFWRGLLFRRLLLFPAASGCSVAVDPALVSFFEARCGTDARRACSCASCCFTFCCSCRIVLGSLPDIDLSASVGSGDLSRAELVIWMILISSFIASHFWSRRVRCSASTICGLAASAQILTCACRARRAAASSRVLTIWDLRWRISLSISFLLSWMATLYSQSDAFHNVKDSPLPSAMTLHHCIALRRFRLHPKPLYRSI